MIVLADLLIIALSFTALPTWLLLGLMLAPAAAISVAGRNPAAIEAGLLAVLAALALYAPLAWAAARLIQRPYAAAFGRFRAVLFVLDTAFFMVLVFSLVQLTLG